MKMNKTRLLEKISNAAQYSKPLKEFLVKS